MAGLDATIDVRGQDEVVAMLTDVADRLRHPDHVNPALADVFRERVAERFASDGDGDWDPLAPETVKRKARRGQDPRILRATGALQHAMEGGQATASETQIEFRPSTTLDRYAYVLTQKRPVWADSETRLLERTTDVLAEFLEGA